MKTKTCSNCKKLKPLSEFYKDKAHKNGLTSQCKQCIKKQGKEYQQTHKERIAKQVKAWQEKHKKDIKKYRKKYNQTHKQELKEYSKKYYQSHKKERARYVRQRRKNDFEFKILANLRNRINMALKNNTKGLRTMQLIGCSVEYLMYHLQKQFKKGMSWDNYGSYWEIDHIRQIAKFDLSKPEEQYKCFKYTNLRPLTAKENRERKKK